MSENVRYNAFISYRHCEPDKTIAKALHRKLENYRIPKELREKLGQNVLGRVFRDEAELPVTDSLSDAILDALRETEFLIVICSPRLKESAWCMKEIEIFTRLHGKKKILPVLIEGEPEDSFPESLFYEDVIEKDPEGNDVTVRIEKEPLAADCRGGHRALRDTVIKLGAAMLGLNYDDLKQRHRVESLKRRTFISGLVFFVVLLFLIQSIYFISTIQKQKDEIERKYADSMANTSAELLMTGDRMAALYVARSVLPDQAGENVSADAFRALVDATHVYSKDVYVSEKRIADSYVYGMTYFSPQCKRVVIGDSLKGSLIDIDTGECIFQCNSSMDQYGFYHNDALLYSTDGHSYYYDIEKGESTALLDEEAQIFSPPSGDVVLLFTRDGIHGYKGSEQVYFTDLQTLGVNMSKSGNYIECFFSEDEKYSLIRIRAFHSEEYNPEWVMQIDLMNGEVMAFFPESYEKTMFGEEEYLLDMDTDGKKMYILTQKMDGNWGRMLHCYDIDKKTITKSVSLGKETFTDLYYIDSKLVILSNDRVLLYDEDFEYISSFGVPMYPQEVLYIDGCYVVRNQIGELYRIDENSAGYEISSDIFEDFPRWDVSAEQWYDDRICIKYAGREGIVIYTRASGDAFKKIEPDEQILSSMFEYENQEKADIFFENLEGFDKEHYMAGCISSDGRYYIACFADGAAVVYDAVTMEKVKDIYDNFSYVYQFKYLEKYDCYAIAVGKLELFDRNFGHLVTINDIWEVYAESDGCVVVAGNNSEYYQLELMDYRQIIELADNILGDYTPSQRLSNKYGL